MEKEKTFKRVSEKTVLLSMILRYLAVGVLCLVGVVMAYMVGCSETLFMSGGTVDCNSFAVNFGGGSCQEATFFGDNSPTEDDPDSSECEDSDSDTCKTFNYTPKQKKANKVTQNKVTQNKVTQNKVTQMVRLYPLTVI